MLGRALVVSIILVLGSTSAPSQSQPWRNFDYDSNLQLPPQPNPEPQGPIVHSPWTKVCPSRAEGNDNEVCFTGRTATIGGVFVAGIVIIDPRDQAKILRVSTSLGVLLQPGTRLSFDEGNFLNAPYLICFANGCLADLAATHEIMMRMRTATNLLVQYIRPARPPDSYTIPLQGFSDAFDHAPQPSPAEHVERDSGKNQSGQTR
jgi:invasion protein IalB